MKKKEKRKWRNFDNVEKQKNFIIPEEFPEGAFGSSHNKSETVRNKSTPWQEEQQQSSAFAYYDKKQHKDVPRRAPGAHRTSDS